jgi:putative hemolysin
MKELIYAIALIAIAMTSIVGGSIQSESHTSLMISNNEELSDPASEACLNMGGEIVLSKSHEGKVYCLLSDEKVCEIDDLLGDGCYVPGNGRD